jgi:hypothetical protein
MSLLFRLIFLYSVELLELESLLLLGDLFLFFLDFFFTYPVAVFSVFYYSLTMALVLFSCLTSANGYLGFFFFFFGLDGVS